MLDTLDTLFLIGDRGHGMLDTLFYIGGRGMSWPWHPGYLIFYRGPWPWHTGYPMGVGWGRGGGPDGAWEGSRRCLRTPCDV